MKVGFWPPSDFPSRPITSAEVSSSIEAAAASTCGSARTSRNTLDGIVGMSAVSDLTT